MGELEMDVLRVIIIKDGDVFVAQGLEKDVCVQAETIQRLIEVFDAQLAFQISDSENIPPAPREYWDMWESDECNDPNIVVQNLDFRVAA